MEDIVLILCFLLTTFWVITIGMLFGWMKYKEMKWSKKRRRDKKLNKKDVMK